MSLIKNLIKEPEIKVRHNYKKKKHNLESTEVNNDDGSGNEKDDKPTLPRPIIKSATDLQRLRVEKLMKNPEKPVLIPEGRYEKDYMQSVPSFVRNVMGSSAGAGSGEFHVYRHLRRKEYARQKQIQMKSQRELLDDEFQKKLEDNKKAAEEKTAKKRAKRMKKKQRKKQRKNESNSSNNKQNKNQQELSSSDEEAEEDDDEEIVKENKEKHEEVDGPKDSDQKDLELDMNAQKSDVNASEEPAKTSARKEKFATTSADDEEPATSPGANNVPATISACDEKPASSSGDTKDSIGIDEGDRMPVEMCEENDDPIEACEQK